MTEDNEKYRLQARYLKEKDLSATEVIAILRADGATQMGTVYALKMEFGMTLSEADSAVLFSSTWADQLEATLELRESFVSVLENYDALSEEFQEG
jgi:hypothetical protein